MASVHYVTTEHTQQTLWPSISINPAHLGRETDPRIEGWPKQVDRFHHTRAEQHIRLHRAPSVQRSVQSLAYQEAQEDSSLTGQRRRSDGKSTGEKTSELVDQRGNRSRHSQRTGRTAKTSHRRAWTSRASTPNDRRSGRNHTRSIDRRAICLDLKRTADENAHGDQDLRIKRIEEDEDSLLSKQYHSQQTLNCMQKPKLKLGMHLGDQT